MEEQLNAGQVFFFRTVSTGQGGAKGQGDRSIRRGREKVESRVLEKAKKWGPRSPPPDPATYQGTTRRKS